MMNFSRYAFYYLPPNGAFADAAAQWLGWDIQRGCARGAVGVLNGKDITRSARKYGFHGTIKPPFRLAQGVDCAQLKAAALRLSAGLRPVTIPALDFVIIEGFLALVPKGDCTDLQNLAADIVRSLDPFRAPLNAEEIAKRRPETLTPRQRELLHIYGYPYVMEQFQFHLTLSDKLDPSQEQAAIDLAQKHFANTLPQPFVMADVCLCGEDEMGRFHLLHRYAFSA